MDRAAAQPSGLSRSPAASRRRSLKRWPDPASIRARFPPTCATTSSRERPGPGCASAGPNGRTPTPSDRIFAQRCSSSTAASLSTGRPGRPRTTQRTGGSCGAIAWPSRRRSIGCTSLDFGIPGAISNPDSSWASRRSSFREWSTPWSTRAGGWKRKAGHSDPRLPCGSKSRRASTGSICTARSISATAGPRRSRAARRRRRGDDVVVLGDGSDGDAAGGMAAPLRDDLGIRQRRRVTAIRFERSQAALLDALLAAQPAITCRRGLRERPRGAAHVRAAFTPVDPPPAFHGELRAYQREGLGWFDFLQRSASAAAWPTTWAWARRSRCWRCSTRGGTRAPKDQRRRRWSSCRARWSSTGGRGRALHPGLQVARLHRPGRATSARRFGEHDLVITTYGTLRTDAAALTAIEFDYVDPRRGAGDQERRDRVREGRAPAPRPAPPGAERHADREPPGRAVDPVRVPQPRHARHRRRSSSAPAPARRARRRRRWTCCRARRCGRSSCAAPRNRSRQELPAKTEQTLHCELERRAAAALRRAARPLPARRCCARSPRRR